MILAGHTGLKEFRSGRQAKELQQGRRTVGSKEIFIMKAEPGSRECLLETEGEGVYFGPIDEAFFEREHGGPALAVFGKGNAFVERGNEDSLGDDRDDGRNVGPARNPGGGGGDRIADEVDDLELAFKLLGDPGEAAPAGVSAFDIRFGRQILADGFEVSLGGGGGDEAGGEGAAGLVFSLEGFVDNAGERAVEALEVVGEPLGATAAGGEEEGGGGHGHGI